MARLITAGAESRLPQAEGLTTTGTVTINTTNPRSGAACYECGPSGDNRINGAISGVADRAYFGRTAFRFDTTPNGNIQILSFRSSITEIFGVYLMGANAEMTGWNNAAALGVGSSLSARSADTWYIAEAKLLVPASGNGTVAWRVLADDGTVLHTVTDQTQNVGTTAIASLIAGHGGTADTVATILVDDFACNDDQGSDENTYSGNRKVYAMPPTADSANTGFSDNPGTTTNLYQALDNRPPIGVAYDPPMPQFKAAGTFQGSASTATPGIPAGTVADDILLLFVESENENITLSTANGFAEVGTQAGQGTAGGATSSRIAVFWKRATGSDSAPVVADAGDHVAARIASFSGCITSGNPWNGTPTWTHDAVSDTTLDAAGPTTTVANSLVVIGAANIIDTNTAQTVSFTNGNLTDLGGTGVGDNTQQGTGGGFNVGTGVKAATGAVGNTTVTYGNATQKSVVVLALTPDTAPAGMTQIGSSNNNTTDNYDGTIQTYTAAGIASDDTVKLVQGRARGGNSTTTNRTAGITVVSNPAVGESTQALGTTAADTEPTGWTNVWTAYSYSPTVTKGTAPVVEVRKGTASTDRMMFDFMALLVEVEPSAAAANEVFGAAAISASGTLTATGIRVQSSSATVSASGTQAAAAFKITQTSAALSGSGTQTSVPRKITQTTSALSGSGTVTSVPFKIASGASTLSGSGTILSVAREAVYGLSSLSGSGSMTSAPFKIAQANAAISGSGNVISMAFKIAQASSAISGGGLVVSSAFKITQTTSTLSGSGSLTADPVVIITASSSISANGSIASIGSRIAGGVITISGSGSLASIAKIIAGGSVSISGSGTTTAIPSAIRAYQAAISGSGTISAAGGAVRPGASSIDGNGALSAIPRASRYGLSAISGNGSVLGAANAIKSGASSISGNGSFIGAGSFIIHASSSISASGLVVASAFKITSTSSALSANSLLISIPSAARSTSAAISGSGNILAVPIAIKSGTTSLSGSGSILSVGEEVAYGLAVLSGEGNLIAVGTKIGGDVVTASLSGSGTLAATGFKIASANAAFSSNGLLVSSPRAIIVGASQISGNGSLTAIPVYLYGGATSLSGTGSVSGAGLLVKGGHSTLSANSNLISTAFKLASAGAILSGQSALVSEAGIVFIATATLSGNGILLGSSSGGTLATATLSGQSLLSSVPSSARRTSANLSGNTVIISSPSRTREAEVSLSGSGSIVQSGATVKSGSVILIGLSELFAREITDAPIFIHVDREGNVKGGARSVTPTAANKNNIVKSNPRNDILRVQ